MKIQNFPGGQCPTTPSLTNGHIPGCDSKSQPIKFLDPPLERFVFFPRDSYSIDNRDAVMNPPSSTHIVGEQYGVTAVS